MPLAQLGLVVHPRRDLEGALETAGEWASKHGVAVGQGTIPGQTRQVAEPVEAASCDLVVSLGGDGTTLAALHAAAPVSRPVLGVACGSIGVLTSVFASRLAPALDQVGAGQVITSITINGELYARAAGDGLVIATPLGSTAYTMAAGGPILGTEGMVVMPLATHGGAAPPLVIGPKSRVNLVVEPGFGGSRFEVDGQELATAAAEVAVSQRGDYATLVTLADQEPL